MPTSSRNRSKAPAARRSVESITTIGYAGTAAMRPEPIRPASEIQDAIDKLNDSLSELDRVHQVLFSQLRPVQGDAYDPSKEEAGQPSPCMTSDLGQQIQKLQFRVYGLTQAMLAESNRLRI